MRFFLIFFILAVVLLIPFLIWGQDVEAMFSPEKAAEWLESLGYWGWLVAVALLVSDILLPIPATALMSALGFVYGAVLGGILGAIGSFLSGAVAYASCRALGRTAAERLAGKRDLERGEALFSSIGGWLVALSRWLPLFPEVIACMAGLALI